MPLSRDEAVQALKDVEQTQSLSRELSTYAGAAPFLFVWGLVWIVGYAGTAYLPAQRPIIWGVVIAIGAISSALIGRSHSGGGSRSLGLSLAIAGIIAAIVGALTVVIQPLGPREIDAVIPLLAAAAYALAGLVFGYRFIVCGLVLGAATVLGYFTAGPQFGYWMAAVGGGCLVLTGLWLRRV